MKVKKVLNTAGYIVFVITSALIILEVIYRNYFLDFYRSEFNGLNSTYLIKNETPKPTILALGDSFTADPRGYVQILRDSLPNQRVINGGIPGTCIKETDIVAPSRIKKFNPRILIYQIYVGNDLLEFNHRINSGKISLLRRSYWFLSDRLYFLSYLNFRLRIFRELLHADLENGEKPKETDSYSPDQYSQRTKLLFEADPNFLENTILVKNSRQGDMSAFLRKLNNLVEAIPKDCSIYILVIPHCAQIDTTYLQRMQQLGAIFLTPKADLEENYPFYVQLKSSIQRDNLYFINALPFLRDANQEKRVFYENDPHLNDHGQTVVGKYLVDLIRKNKQLQ
ncbi:MAG: hypothetical protein KDC53_03155 [Saprospiraceae bacterium]|nr:hypothetical protein [Saprospiraceae bacterium]